MKARQVLVAAALALAAGAAGAQPAIIFELGGKNDKSFGEAAWKGAEAWKKASTRYKAA